MFVLNLWPTWSAGRMMELSLALFASDIITVSYLALLNSSSGGSSNSKEGSFS